MSQKMVHERGNALIIILVVIALLAALTVTITRLSAKSSGNLSAEQARIQAENMMRTAQTYETAVQKLVNINRCSENELNFDNTLTTVSYTNPNAFPDKHCDIFDVSGAGLKYESPNPAFLDSGESAKSEYGEWVFNSTQCVLEVGTGDTTCNDTNVELMVILPHIKKEICVEINNLNGITNPTGNPPNEDQQGTTFIGTFTADADPEIGEGATGTNLIRHTTGCYQDSGGLWLNSYIFYHVILVR